MPDPIDTANLFLVGGRGGDIVIGMLPRGPITHAQALNLAAYLVAIVGDDDAWQATLHAIENT